MNNILVSIITVTYNSEKTIRKTIESVLSQTYKNIEYIIIDGNSSDSTVKIVESYSSKFDNGIKIISEPDNGIYDAMNKGIKMASGDLIGIINSDDYYEPDAVENIVKSMSKDKYQVLYGMLRYIRNNVEVKVSMPKHENIDNEMIAHPTCFLTKNIYEDFYNYNTDYKSCSDYELMIKLSKESDVKFIPVYKIIASFTCDIGVSSQKKSKLETIKMKRKYGLISLKKYFLYLVYYNIIK